MHILGPSVRIRVFATVPQELAIALADTKVLLAREQCAPTIAMTEELAGQRRSWRQKPPELTLRPGTP